MADAPKKSLPEQLQEQVKESVVDIRNEAIVQSANLYLTVRKVLMASLGAFALTSDEMRTFIDKLVERGEVAEADVRKMLDELRASSRQRAAEASQQRTETRQRASAVIEDSIGTILERFNVPRQSDLDALYAQIELLDNKIAALATRQQQRPAQPETPAVPQTEDQASADTGTDIGTDTDTDAEQTDQPPV